MAKKIIWTSQAEKTFAAVIKYLETNWTEKEIKKFIRVTDKVVHNRVHTKLSLT